MNVNLCGTYKYLTDENIRYYKDLFDDVSIDKKYITFDQFKKIVTNIGYIPSIYELNDIKDEINNGYNGKLDFIYYLVILSRIHRELKINNIKEYILNAFKTINTSGNITKGELYNFFKKNKRFTKLSFDEIDELFEYLDDNNNNIIEIDEIIKALNKIY